LSPAIKKWPGELNHRTQNTLANVPGIAAQTLHGVVDQEVVNAFEGRILALAKAQSLLGRRNWEAVGVREVIEHRSGHSLALAQFRRAAVDAFIYVLSRGK
jgi:two-component sensor histidine kinase